MQPATVGFTRLPDTRALHSRTVSYLMGVLAPTIGLCPEEAALCGWLHDFAYCISDNQHHAKAGGELLKRQGYAHWAEIADHGSLAGLDTPLGVLLNVADMMVDSTGRIVRFEQRLRDVAARYGEASIQYAKCREVIAAIKRTREWLRLDAALRESGLTGGLAG